MENSAPVDRISNLPTEILCHILSFLPTKFAFRTNVLSKRWTPLYKLLTSLNFDDQSVHGEHALLRFCRMVDKVMLSYKLIKKFQINCGSTHWNRFSVDGWIEIVKRHPIENLQIASTLDSNLFRQSSFIFPKLVVLNLKRLEVTSNISFDLPSLKTLSLKHVYFKNQENFSKLLSGCPILEDLHTRIHYKEQSKSVNTGGFKNLSKLIKANICAFDVPYKAIQDVQILVVAMKKRLPDPEINSYDMSFPIFQSLIHLHLCFSFFHQCDDIVEVLQYCPNLQKITINKIGFDKNLFINHKYPNFVPECISSHLRLCTINYQGFGGEVQFATYILQNARLLRVMKINISHYLNQKENERSLEELSLYQRKISPECDLSLVFTYATTRFW